jgi:uncharacterized membrane protein YsdA (DUF1294 family)/cold shock CspA family protein
MPITDTRCSDGGSRLYRDPGCPGWRYPTQGADDVTSDEAVGRQQGVLADWNDDRGFGFITPAAGRSRVFVHVSAFPRGRRPVTGCEVTYTELRDDRNRTRASDVRYLGPVSGRRAGPSGIPLALAAATLFFTLLVGLLVVGELPATLLAAYGLFSGVAFLMYGADKSAAEQGRWRTSESTLHTIALMGGWPGALVARRVFRHKTIKQPFRTIFWFTVIANCVVLAWFVYEAPLTLP